MGVFRAAHGAAGGAGGGAGAPAKDGRGRRSHQTARRRRSVIVAEIATPSDSTVPSETSSPIISPTHSVSTIIAPFIEPSETCSAFPAPYSAVGDSSL